MLTLFQIILAAVAAFMLLGVGVLIRDFIRGFRRGWRK